jgi:phosphatidylserine/phosphatidylglycerophosphate/cardiolipin synthase-like enzyme
MILSSFVVAIILSYPVLVRALPASDVTPIPPRGYFDQVHPLLQNAQKTIRLILYEIRYYPRFKNSPTNQLIQALIEAHRRGVSVEVIVEESSDHAVDNAQQNHEAAALLEEAGIPVYFDSPTTTTHDKILVIDDRYVIIGSTNWSYHALEKNNESSVLVDSPELAKYYLRYFDGLKENH